MFGADRKFVSGTAFLSEAQVETSNEYDLLGFTIGNFSTLQNNFCDDVNFTLHCKLDDISDCTKSNNELTTFAVFFALCFAGSYVSGAVMGMLEASTIAAARRYSVNIGNQKILALVALAFTPFISGLLSDVYSQAKGYQSFLPTYLLSTACFIVALTIIPCAKLTVDKNRSKIFSQFASQFKRPEVVLFLFFCLLIGYNFGTVKPFMFLFLKTLHVPNYFIGLVLMVSSLASIPILIYSEWIKKKIGVLNIYLLGFACYAFRLFGYSFITNPWVVIGIEILEAGSLHLLWVVCLSICSLLAPKGLLASFSGVAGVCFYSIGKGVGSFSTGLLIRTFGMRKTFRISGCFVIVQAILYFIVHISYLDKVYARIEREKQEAQEKERLSGKLFDEVEMTLLERHPPSKLSDK